MKKMLFVSPRNPFLNRYSGDVIRSKKFVEAFKKKYKVTLITTENSYLNKKFSNLKLITFKNENFIFKLIFIFTSFLKLQPLQLGYFYSSDIRNFIKKNFKSYDVVFSQSVRVAQYVLDLKIRKILDMGDLYSNNYAQTYKNKNIFSPSKFLYFIESKFIRKYENLCFAKFDRILLFSKKEINSIKINKKKVKQINFGIDQIKKKFRYDTKNNKIIFIGNIKYLPNRIACKNFIKKILPEVNRINKNIEFHIIGEISKIDKFLWQNKKVKIHGKIKNLEPFLSGVFCGLANLSVSSGIQTKLLTYMSYGIPSISSNQVIENFDSIKSSSLPTYKNKEDFIRLILKLKNNKNFSQSISKKSLKIIKKFKWSEVLKNIVKI